MANEDESIVIVYNGEVYNAPALRQDLERRGVRFRTRSDTEVILRLYEEDPEHVEEHLVGMWAFAIHDRRRRRVVLSRDRFGIKPLFVADAGDALAFASELRCFDRASQPFARLFAIDHDAAHAMVSWSYVPETATIYAGVRRLAAGHAAERGPRDASVGRARTYWTLEPSPEAARVRSLDDACERGRVSPAARRAEHLESDVPVASFLSGGIDSSLVTAYANEESAAPIKAYSIGFRRARASTSRPLRGRPPRGSGRRSTSRCSTRRRRAAACRTRSSRTTSRSATRRASRPTCCREHVGRDFKVALGGDGGDEVFAGYKKYLVVHLRKPFAAVPRVRDALGACARSWRCRSGTTGARLGRAAATDPAGWHALDGSDAHVYAQLTQFAPLARTRCSCGGRPPRRHFEEETRARFSRGRRARSSSNRSPRDLGSMLTQRHAGESRPREHGVQPRGARAVPRSSRRRVRRRAARASSPSARAARRSGASVCSGRCTSVVLDRALARREKQGFGVPVQKWLEGPFDCACAAPLRQAPARSLRDPLERRALRTAGSGDGFRGDDPSIVWHAFALAAWCEATLGDGPDALRDLIEPRTGKQALAVPAVGPPLRIASSSR